MGNRAFRGTGKGSTSEDCRRTAWLRPAALAVLLVVLQPAPRAAAELIDHIVASVNRDAITLSELNQAVGFNRELGGGAGENVREETLQGLVNRQLLLQEAARLKFVDITPQEVRGEVEKLRSRLGSDRAFNDFLSKLDMTEEQLSRMLEERLTVERFVEKKIALFVRVSRDEAEQYFSRHPERFKGKQFLEVQKVIMAGLQARKVDEQLDRYVAELQSRADIRINP